MMTEQQWDECREPRRMLEQLTSLRYGRKLTLFISSCCFRASHLCSEHPPGQRAPTYATDFAERLVDGNATLAELDEYEGVLCYAPAYERAAVEAAVQTCRDVPPANWPRCSAWDWPERLQPPELAVEAVVEIAREEARLAVGRDYDVCRMAWPALLALRERATAAEEAAVREEKRFLCHLLRDVIGNPFRPIAFDSGWLTPGMRAVAEAAYTQRSAVGELDPARVGDLADALQEAGCSAPAVLWHLRERSPHVRGCNVLDVVLGKP